MEPLTPNSKWARKASPHMCSEGKGSGILICKDSHDYHKYLALLSHKAMWKPCCVNDSRHSCLPDIPSKQWQLCVMYINVYVCNHNCFFKRSHEFERKQGRWYKRGAGRRKKEGGNTVIIFSFQKIVLMIKKEKKPSNLYSIITTHCPINLHPTLTMN